LCDEGTFISDLGWHPRNRRTMFENDAVHDDKLPGPVTPTMQSLIVDQTNLYAARGPARAARRDTAGVARHERPGACGLAGPARAARRARLGGRGPARAARRARPGGRGLAGAARWARPGARGSAGAARRARLGARGPAMCVCGGSTYRAPLKCRFAPSRGLG
jgi:hypothetical protein